MDKVSRAKSAATGCARCDELLERVEEMGDRNRELMERLAAAEGLLKREGERSVRRSALVAKASRLSLEVACWRLRAEVAGRELEREIGRRTKSVAVQYRRKTVYEKDLLAVVSMDLVHMT